MEKGAEGFLDVDGVALTQILQPIQRSSEMKAILSFGPTSIQNLPAQQAQRVPPMLVLQFVPWTKHARRQAKPVLLQTGCTYLTARASATYAQRCPTSYRFHRSHSSLTACSWSLGQKDHVV